MMYNVMHNSAFHVGHCIEFGLTTREQRMDLVNCRVDTIRHIQCVMHVYMKCLKRTIMDDNVGMAPKKMPAPTN